MKDSEEAETRGAIYLKDGELLQVELDPMTFLQTQTVDNTKDTYPQVQVVNGTTYVLASHLDEEVWQIEDGKLTKKEEVLLNNRVVHKFRAQHPCPREGCTKVYSTLHHLKVHFSSNSLFYLFNYLFI